MKKQFQKRFINYLIKGLVHGITKDDILKVERTPNKTIISMAGKTLTEEQVSLLKEECEILSNMFFWKIVCEKRIRYMAYEKGFEGSSVDGDLWMGKSMIYNLDIIKQVIQEVKSLK